MRNIVQKERQEDSEFSRVAGISDSDEESEAHDNPEAETQPRVRRIMYPKYAAIALASVALIGTVLATLAMMRGQSEQTWPPRSPRQLLESREFIAHTAAQVRSLGKGILSADEEADVQEGLALGLRRHFDALDQHVPHASSVLDHVQLTDKQQKKIFRMVGRFGDPRVRTLALKVARVAQAHKGESEATVGAYILQALQENPDDLQHVLAGISSTAMQLPKQTLPSNASLNLSPDKARLMATYDGWDVDVVVAKLKVTPSGRMRASKAQTSRKLEEGGGGGEAGRKVHQQVHTYLKMALEMLDLVFEALEEDHIEVPNELKWGLEAPLHGVSAVSCALEELETAWDVVFCVLIEVTSLFKWILRAFHGFET